jgi:hypothetical protein
MVAVYPDAGNGVAARAVLQPSNNSLWHTHNVDSITDQGTGNFRFNLHMYNVSNTPPIGVRNSNATSQAYACDNSSSTISHNVTTNVDLSATSYIQTLHHVSGAVADPDTCGFYLLQEAAVLNPLRDLYDLPDSGVKRDEADYRDVESKITAMVTFMPLSNDYIRVSSGVSSISSTNTGRFYINLDPDVSNPDGDTSTTSLRPEEVRDSVWTHSYAGRVVGQSSDPGAFVVTSTCQRNGYVGTTYTGTPSGNNQVQIRAVDGSGSAFDPNYVQVVIV